MALDILFGLLLIFLSGVKLFHVPILFLCQLIDNLVRPVGSLLVKVF